MLSEPASAITDLLLGLTALALCFWVRGKPGIHSHWPRTFAWTAAAALAGAVHHGFVTSSESWKDPSWAVVTGLVVIAISYLLAASVQEVLGPGHARTFWFLRSGSLVAYAIVAATGNAGIGAIVACEGVTMVAVLALWAVALRRGHPLALPVGVALVACMVAGGVRSIPNDVWPVLDTDSFYHLAQIPGLVLLALAVLSPRRWAAGAALAGAPAKAAYNPSTRT
jgi:hypothetical protein